ncbi:MAG: hypothetical protein V4608_05380 [Bacteroidota bacterium]
MTKISLDDYRVAIENLAATSSDFVFANSGAEHACIVMSNIFKTAKGNVNIFAKNLKGDVSKGEYLIQMENYLKTPTGNLKVVLEELIQDGASEAIKLMQKYAHKVSVYVMNPDYLSSRTQINHFTLADDKMFRYETDTVAYTAVCSFNDTKTCSQLNNLYSLYLDNSTKIPKI